jgi:hypothetical protein
MDVKRMIEVLQAHERGEKVEVLLDAYLNTWSEWKGEVIHMDMAYRIAPKPPMTLIEEARAASTKPMVDFGKLCIRLADRIEELEEILHENVERIDNDLLMTLLKKRLRK